MNFPCDDLPNNYSWTGWPVVANFIKTFPTAIFLIIKLINLCKWEKLRIKHCKGQLGNFQLCQNP